MPLAPLLDAAFLKPFTRPNAETLARILADLYAESRRASQPLSRETALDIVILHTLAPGEDDPLPRAQMMLAELEADGWLRTEVQPDYTRAVALSPRAFQLLQFAQASSPSIPELIVTIHDLLKSALLDVDNQPRLAAATRLTEQLMDALKALQHVTIDTDPLPDTSRYRAGVLEAAAKLEGRGHTPARFIREKFQNLDNLLDDITARRTRLTARDTQPSAAASHLRAIIAQLAGADRKTLAKHLDSLIQLYHSASTVSNAERPISTQSVQSPTEFAPVNWPAPEITQADLAVARRGIQQQLNRPVSPDRLRRLAGRLIENRQSVRAADLVAEGRADLPLLIQLRLHADDSPGYSIEEQQWVEINGLVFRDFLIKNPNYVAPFTDEDLSVVLGGAGSDGIVTTQQEAQSVDGEQNE